MSLTWSRWRSPPCQWCTRRSRARCAPRAVGAILWEFVFEVDKSDFSLMLEGPCVGQVALPPVPVVHTTLCRTTSASTASCPSRWMCCLTHCASYSAPCQPLCSPQHQTLTPASPSSSGGAPARASGAQDTLVRAARPGLGAPGHRFPPRGLILANIHENTISVGTSIRPICTRRCVTLTNISQVCSNFCRVRVFIMNTRPDEVPRWCTRRSRARCAPRPRRARAPPSASRSPGTLECRAEGSWGGVGRRARNLLSTSLSPNLHP